MLTAYTDVPTNNLEPIYGIALAWIFFGSQEQMNPLFYVGAIIIVATVIANEILKHSISKKQT